MKKNDIKDYMIVETGYEEQKFLVMAGKLVDGELVGYSLEDFDDELIHRNHKPESISKVYASVELEVPFEINVIKIFEEQKPRVLWERTPTKLSKKLLSKMTKEQIGGHLDKITFPCVVE